MFNWYYYPFGLKHQNYNQTKKTLKLKEADNSRYAPQVVASAYKYKYNGKEWQDELGLNEYDLGARGHDPARVNFGSIDPRAEDYYSQSPYAFYSNNPMFFIDINGEGVDTDYILFFEEVRNFLVGFSDKVIRKKIAGYEAITNSTKQKSVWTYMYKYNTETESRSRITRRKNTTFTTHFHVHPYGDDTPSDTDFKSKIKRLKSGLSIPSVIYYSTGKNKSASKKY